ncbi:hypothetical protein OJ997_17550 [Solirubrobacter phytolaccae]|uniref:Uncharacterized protein n=1 Tax=Solirubrobacter phytolaccae TaxID=1404360 RepID=A0A9X3NC50_9ACTN|nr:hypothetical protein [Solirubrobacter phytolaccae]MDA0182115.1 hypothetical protein [Solirubrobacter phytolaccae]
MTLLAAVLLAIAVLSGSLSFWIDVDFNRSARSEPIEPAPPQLAIEPWNPPALAESGLQLGLAWNERGELMVIQLPEDDFVQVRTTFALDAPLESIWAEGDAGISIYGATTAEVRSVRFTGHGRPREVKTERVPGDRTRRLFSAHFTRAQEEKIRRIVGRDRHGKTVIRLPVNTAPGPVQ